MKPLTLTTDFTPKGDQQQAIDALVAGLQQGRKFQTLLGVTGSGKTYTMAQVIQAVQRPTLIISHNKTLAAQLFGEFKAFFSQNAVEYFVSYYDYYQPEAYIPQSDTYIEKETDTNQDLDRLRLRATSSLLERRDVVIIASVSCIYGLGSPEQFEALHIMINVGQEIERDKLLANLIDIQYNRNDIAFERGKFRVTGERVDVWPAYEDVPTRIDFFGDTIERIYSFNAVTNELIEDLDSRAIYPAKHFVTTADILRRAVGNIEDELNARLIELKNEDKLVEMQRLAQRVRFDIEMMMEVGYTSGIENYSRHLTFRKQGDPPPVLIDYFPDNWLLIVDESHATLPQIRGMWHGDRNRKQTLIDYGFRLPSALDNRPLYFEEFLGKVKQGIFVSATPGDWEIEQSGGEIVEQVIRPTGLLDPEIIVRPIEGQIDDLVGRIRGRIARKERVLVTTLTKKMSEQLTEYLSEMGLNVRYLHSEVETLDRVEILRDLRLGNFDVLVGINLLREGLDLPEVSLVAILDADKEGFLRSHRSLIQTSGRAARHVEGQVIFYADKMTDAIKRTIEETNRRRAIQRAYNEEHGIIPQSVHKSIDDIMAITRVADAKSGPVEPLRKLDTFEALELEAAVIELEREMRKAAKNLEYEYAAQLRDKLAQIRKVLGKKT